ncbi:MAG: DNA polymerase III subunit delta' [Frankiaceae bacterium]|nr:DNA polymerase III subunit delta' [Frankiaceae bacterium]
MSVFADLVGQERVVAQLQAAARDAASVVAGHGGTGEGMTHAWLFTGPPGSGRSNAARAFAAALQCEAPGEPGCGHCDACHQALTGAHPDVAMIVPEGLSLKVEEARQIIVRSSRAPTRGRWQVTLIEDADRLTESGANALLKALEEPPPRSVLLLSAPSVQDLLPTIRSRCRLAALRTPPAEAVASVLIHRDGVDPAMAAFAARAAQGHIGRAKRLATDEDARRERRDVLSLPRSLQGVGSALSAAKDLVDAAQAEAAALTKDRDVVERESLATAMGAGATGKGVTGGSRGSAGALKELEKRQKSRGTRTSRDALDRALVDLAAFYRDVLQLQLGTGTALVHADLSDQAATIARATTAESTLRRIDAVLACRVALDANVAPLLAVEAMALALRTG